MQDKHVPVAAFLCWDKYNDGGHQDTWARTFASWGGRRGFMEAVNVFNNITLMLFFNWRNVTSWRQLACDVTRFKLNVSLKWCHCQLRCCRFLNEPRCSVSAACDHVFCRYGALCTRWALIGWLKQHLEEGRAVSRPVRGCFQVTCCLLACGGEASQRRAQINH